MCLFKTFSHFLVVFKTPNLENEFENIIRNNILKLHHTTGILERFNLIKCASHTSLIKFLNYLLYIGVHLNLIISCIVYVFICCIKQYSKLNSICFGQELFSYIIKKSFYVNINPGACTIKHFEFVIYKT
jgi:hypothetical protein